ncbi:hypothetical protein [Anaerobutyricum hallii]|uniref:hypothetical protein n=1 Tax=Anaerobutyricum hallii TaxID=39488 RepID=UPI003996547B
MESYKITHLSNLNYIAVGTAEALESYKITPLSNLCSHQTGCLSALEPYKITTLLKQNPEIKAEYDEVNNHIKITPLSNPYQAILPNLLVLLPYKITPLSNSHLSGLPKAYSLTTIKNYTPLKPVSKLQAFSVCFTTI